MPERRAFIRVQPNSALPCNVNVVLGGRRWPARIAEFSTDGVGIISDSWLPAETTLVIEISDPGGANCRTFLARLCHATRRPSGDYHLGARLVNHLTEKQVAELTQAV